MKSVQRPGENNPQRLSLGVPALAILTRTTKCKRLFDGPISQGKERERTTLIPYPPPGTFIDCSPHLLFHLDFTRYIESKKKIPNSPALFPAVIRHNPPNHQIFRSPYPPPSCLYPSLFSFSVKFINFYVASLLFHHTLHQPFCSELTPCPHLYA